MAPTRIHLLALPLLGAVACSQGALSEDRRMTPQDATPPDAARTNGDAGRGEPTDGGVATPEDAGDGDAGAADAGPPDATDAAVPRPEGCPRGETRELPPVLADMPPNSWRELPDTDLRRVCACEDGFEEVCGVQGCGSGVFSYSGGIYDEGRHRFVSWGGGHNAYYGNELYAFELDTLQWSRIDDPSPPNEFRGECIDTLADGSANSRHTYDGLAYMGSLDRMFSAGGSLACGAGYGAASVWHYDFAGGGWTRPSLSIPEGTKPFGGHLFNYAAEFDCTTDMVFWEGTFGLYRYDPTTHAVTKHGPIGSGGDVGDHIQWAVKNAAIAESRRLFISVGGGDTRVYDLETGELERLALPEGVGGGGFDYREGRGEGFAWSGDPADEVFRFDVESRAWSGTGAVGGPPGADRTAGIYGRWFYDPVYDRFFAIGLGTANVHAYRPPE